jgi:hypothetical protein
MRKWNEAHGPDKQMHWGNIEIDHIKPVLFARENTQWHSPLMHLCHYTNLQPLLKVDNRIKCAKWSAEADAHWIAHIYQNESHCAIFMP